MGYHSRQTEGAMRVHIFKASGDLYGFTPEESGSNLPADKGPWAWYSSIEVFKEFPMTRSRVDEAKILAAIEGQGFFLTNAAIGP
jgi:hypothetical protein